MILLSIKMAGGTRGVAEWHLPGSHKVLDLIIGTTMYEWGRGDGQAFLIHILKLIWMQK